MKKHINLYQGKVVYIDGGITDIVFNVESSNPKNQAIYDLKVFIPAHTILELADLLHKCPNPGHALWHKNYNVPIPCENCENCAKNR